ncbi:hypothetical protein ACSBR1_022864 [Camellia fascicularis]
MKEIEAQSANTDHYEKPTVCVLDASTYVGFWILKRLLFKGPFVLGLNKWEEIRMDVGVGEEIRMEEVV